MLSWLMAKQQHVMKYAEIYIERRFDVLIVASKPWHVLWPAKGSHRIAADVLNILAANNENYSSLVIHGFSAGGYLWGECLRLYRNDSAKYHHLMSRVTAQIWDSAVDLNESHIGMSKTVFPSNNLMQKLLQHCIQLYLNFFYDSTMCHLVNSSATLHAAEEVKAPALIFISKTDSIGTEDANRKMADNWIRAGVDVTWKCFDASPHVGHFVKYRDDYLESLLNHLRSVNLI